MQSIYNIHKNKVFVYILLLGVVMFGVMFYISYMNYHSKLQKQFMIRSTSLQNIIKTEEERIVKLYQSRLKKNLKSYGVVESISTNDSQRLYSLIKPRYEELKKENRFFSAMHFHNKDNTSFLRMHRPEKNGDDLSSFRQIVVDTNREVKPFHGFEKGKYGYFYRVITPVIDKNIHLGSVEFGLSLEYFADNLKRLVPNTNFGFLLNKDIIDIYDHKIIGDHGLIVDYNSFFSPLAQKIDLIKEFQTIEVAGRSYIISSNLYIKDYKGNDTIRILFAMDITEFKDEIASEFIFLLLIGGLTYLVSFLIINAAFKKYILSIEEQSKQLKEHTQLIDEYVIISRTDEKGIINYASDAFCKISGYSKGELIGNAHNIIRHPDMHKETFKNMWETIKEKKVWRGEVKNKRKNGTYYWVDAVITPNIDEDDTIKGYTAVRVNITDKKIIEKISQTDKLTSIYNRQKLDDTLESELSRTKRYQTPFSIILMDIDKFKSVNDTYGHQVGDKVLIETAKILSKHVRKTDTLGRWGGEEFMIICSETDLFGAESLAEKLREDMENFTFDTVGHKTGSFGISQYIFGEDIKDTLKRCDDALYMSKSNGRNQVTSL